MAIRAALPLEASRPASRSSLLSRGMLRGSIVHSALAYEMLAILDNPLLRCRDLTILANVRYMSSCVRLSVVRLSSVVCL